MRLIDADALKESLKELEAESNSIRYTQGLQDAVDYYFPQIIDDAPTIDAEPIVHAHWIEKNDRITCSNCGREVMYNSDYLPQTTHFCYNCGAKMDGGENE